MLNGTLLVTTLVILVILAIAVGVVVLWQRRRLPPPSPTSDGETDGATREQVPLEPAPGETETTTLEPPTKVPPFVPAAEQEFAVRAEKFGGLYESLHRACLVKHSADRCRRVLESWEIRFIESDAEALRGTWQDVLRETTGQTEISDGETDDDEAVLLLGTKWLRLLHAWGMERDERTMFEFTEADEDRYFLDRIPQAGGRVEVETPCWTRKGRVIERGVAWTVEGQ